jgi:hypothetical protein
MTIKLKIDPSAAYGKWYSAGIRARIGDGCPFVKINDNYLRITNG